MRVWSSRSLWISLAAIAAGIFFFRVFSLHHTKPVASGTIPDLSVTSPLNQPGGGDVSAEAYEVYSALYQQPQQEPLAFAEDSQTDIPQVNGSCLKPSTPQEHEMADGICGREPAKPPLGEEVHDPGWVSALFECRGTKSPELHCGPRKRWRGLLAISETHARALPRRSRIRSHTHTSLGVCHENVRRRLR